VLFLCKKHFFSLLLCSVVVEQTTTNCLHIWRINHSYFDHVTLAGKAGATLFFGNLSLDLDEKALTKEIELFTGDACCHLLSLIITITLLLPPVYCVTFVGDTYAIIISTNLIVIIIISHHCHHH
jgi:hypothetical protein